MTRVTASHPPLVLIDVDGTISDSLAGIQDSFRLAMQAIDHPLPSDAFLSRLAGPPMLDSLAELGLDDAHIQRAMAAYMQGQRDGGWAQTTMFDGWPELLRAWRQEGFLISTATSKGHYYAEKVLRLFGIHQYFDFIAAADVDRGLVTKSDVIAHALRHFGRLAGDEEAEGAAGVEGAAGAESAATDGSGAASATRPGVVMVGDRIHDFASAREFGVASIAVGWGYGDEEERREATRIAADTHTLDKHVRELLYL